MKVTRRRPAAEGRRELISPQTCARLIVSGIVGITGDRRDIVIDPTSWDRCIVLAGDGSAERSFELAADLKARLEAAVLKVLVDFSEKQAAA